MCFQYMCYRHTEWTALRPLLSLSGVLCVCVCVCVCVEDKSIVVYKHNHFGTFWEFTGVSTGVRVCTDYQ